ncbi:gamma-butyrobetaine dioxygenase-like [Ptychodera flava]|uniref:gamma-butyrobetaine dioxygenase-like n=1 Tax=Ptychodera flava TaxID=63121 RepID=UPI00396A160D
MATFLSRRVVLLGRFCNQLKFQARSLTTFSDHRCRFIFPVGVRNCGSGGEALRAVLKPAVPLVTKWRCLGQAAHSSISENCSLEHAEKQVGRREVRVRWGDGFESAYPFVWLRDNCFCPSCYEATAQARMFLVEDLDVEIVPTDVKVALDGRSLTVCWPGGHQSNFSSEFLRATEFSERRPTKHTHLWGSELLQNLPRFQFQNLLEDDRVLLQYMETLWNVGLVLVQNVPQQTGQIQKLAEKISFLRVTTYGPTFTVKAKVKPSNAAYTGSKLGLHTDMPQYYFTPSIQILHCIEQSSTGGDSTFSDGFKAAFQLKQENPEAYELLSANYIDYVDVGTDFLKYHTESPHAVITLDHSGELSQIHYNNPIRGTQLRMPTDRVYPYYRAMKAFDDILNRPENIITLKMDGGDMAAFDNVRVLHGRTAFTFGERHLEGGYMDWDDVLSKVRVLRRRFGLPVNDF